MKIHKQIFNIIENGKKVETYNLTGKTVILINTTRDILTRHLKQGQELEEISKDVNVRRKKPVHNIVANGMNFNVFPANTIGYHVR